MNYEFTDRNVGPSRFRQLMMSENIVDRRIVHRQTVRSSDQSYCSAAFGPEVYNNR